MRKFEIKMDTIDFADWEKLDIKVGKILKAEEIEGADKLLKLSVDTGDGKGKERTLVAGIKQHYNIDELVGKKIIVLCNLASRKMKGVESQGMLLAAVDGDEVVLLGPEKDIKQGSKVS